MELRQQPNDEFFTLYEGELVFHHRSARGIHEVPHWLNLKVGDIDLENVKLILI